MSQIRSFTEYFKNESDVFCQNISGCNVSVNFEIGPGVSDGYLFPNSKDPVNLTRYIPFNAIKQSMDLRKMLNRSPPALRLMTEAEYTEYFEHKAKEAGMTVDEVLELSEQRRVAARNHLPLPDAVPPEEKNNSTKEEKVAREIKTAIALEEDVINPRVLHLCLQVHPSLPEQSKMTAQDLLSELDSVNGLTQQDWDYVSSHGYYRSVIKLARSKVAKLAAAAVEEKPKTKVKKTKEVVKEVEE